MADIGRRLDELTEALNQTQQALQASQQEVQRLRAELGALQSQNGNVPVPSGAEASQPAAPLAATATADSSASSSGTGLDALREQLEAIQAEVQQHDQIKVETVSKYPVRVTGLILFNAFSNAGVVDDAGLPTIALPRNPGTSHGSAGVAMRQSILGLEATGPRLFAARSSAQISIDFFGGVSTNTFGYTTTTGLLRLRRAQIALDWKSTSVVAGMIEPLFSPLSPTSYATVAEPALSASGNLWAWVPQLRVAQRIPFSGQRSLVLEGGLIDPGSASYITTQLVDPVEAARRPGYEGRVSYREEGSSTATPRPFVLGAGAYSSEQFYNSTTNVHSWAVSGDWQIPILSRIELTGEAYRGRSLGDFGGGSYKDILTGVDTATGLARSSGLDVVGGWNQIKLRIAAAIEANATFGMDDALSSNFDGLTLSSSTAPFELYARNSSVIGNLIFRPRTYLILSPEYRHIESWRYTGSPNVANIFTIAAGYQF